MSTSELSHTIHQYDAFRKRLSSIYEREHARLERKYVPWGLSATWGYWLSDWQGRRPAVSGADASIGEDEIRLFHDLCQLIDPRSAYVIGHSFGLSSVALALAAPRCRIVAIDNWSDADVGAANRELSQTIIARNELSNLTLFT